MPARALAPVADQAVRSRLASRDYGAADDGFDVGDGAEVRIVADLDFVEPDYG